MPKLSANAAKAVQETEAVHGGGDFEPLAAGKYLGRLADVKVRDQLNKHGAPQWSAEFQNLVSMETLEGAPGRQWLELTVPTGSKVPASYTNGPEKWAKYQAMVQGRLNAFFEAFGYTADSDTDEMLNEWAIITLKIETIQQGPKEGQLTNRVVDIEAVPEDFDWEAAGVNPMAPNGDDDTF
ncbi:hypothetical protein PBI_JOHANN_49 [Microbacterium phage Johann]|uniref:Uncharacterized protein n=2 Tax=Goodmanvirus goodman TaxID=2734238 RepID=A0A3G3LZP6_9CAUD|nr:hypothetical protein HOU56_gp49 [Microbacterium phage Goodman]AYQ99504.1 hypothetical protein PBI_GOODMAN_49 [Microbacterium phage Goodman]AYQ99672.1 hypothetical protein PBI_JOHANN_49 [Microbacterium phage Johann]